MNAIPQLHFDAPRALSEQFRVLPPHSPHKAEKHRAARAARFWLLTHERVVKHFKRPFQLFKWFVHFIVRNHGQRSIFFDFRFEVHFLR